MHNASKFSGEQLAAILKAMPDPVFILGRSGRYVEIFGGMDVRYFHDPASQVGKTLHDLLSPEKAGWFMQQLDTALQLRGLHVVEYSLAPSDIKGLDGDGPSQRLWFEGRIQVLDFQVAGEEAVLWVASNITARKELEVKLRLQSEVDELSGLYNRRKLLQILSEHFDTFARYATPTALLMFDIDHFKRINDELGHLTGDLAIRATADTCRRDLRATDAAARLGGDEFVVLMPHTKAEHAVLIAERLRQRIAAALQPYGQDTTVSGGLACFVAGDANCEEVLRRADEALYQAKRSGRNRICSAQ